MHSFKLIYSLFVKSDADIKNETNNQQSIKKMLKKLKFQSQGVQEKTMCIKP